jgi:histidine triad (HIT) family protein
MAENCIFCKLASRQIPVQPIYEDDEFLVIPDLEPQAPVHVLILFKAHFPSLLDVTDSGLLGRALETVRKTAQTLGLTDGGFRTVINTREDGGQTIPHLHIHLLGGRFMQWPPG